MARDDGFVFGGALHCMPRGAGRSRLLFRTYYSSRGGIPRWARLLLRLKPLWARHLNSCKILEQDVALITSQEDHLARSGKSFAQSHLVVLASSDRFVLAYRRWLDAVGHGMPWAIGWDTSSHRPPAAVPHVSLPGHRSQLSRYERHVVLSRHSRVSLKRATQVKRIALAAFATLAAGAYAAPPASLPLSARLVGAVATLGAAGAAAAAAAVERAFHQNFERHPK